MTLRRALCVCSLLLLPLVAPAARAVVITLPPTPPSYTVVDGADADVSQDGDMRVEIVGGSLSVSVLDVAAGGSITIDPRVTLVASDTLSLCAEGAVYASGQLDASVALNLDAGGACDLGELFAFDDVVRFLGPTAGTVTLRATGDVTIVPEPTAGSLIAVTATAGLVARRLRRPGPGPLRPAP